MYSNVTSAHLSITRASTILPLSSTFANKEKVWKKEQADIAEKAKIEQLQKEIEQNRAVEDLQQQAVKSSVQVLVKYSYLSNIPYWSNLL